MLLVKLLLGCEQLGLLHQLLQYHILHDSMPVALTLIKQVWVYTATRTRAAPHRRPVVDHRVDHRVHDRAPRFRAEGTRRWCKWRWT